MKVVFFIMLMLAAALSAIAQSPASATQALIDTEKSFARLAAEKGTKAAFLANLADDGVVFEPLEVNGKLVWQARPESAALLSWNPAWADLSSDGQLGFTTGGWEYRPKGKGDKPTDFGDYLSIWQKQNDGSFKVILDIGIGHPATTLTSGPTLRSTDAGSGVKTVAAAVDDGILMKIFSTTSLANGYFNYLADDVRVLREGSTPFNGKSAAFVGLEKHDKDFPADGFLKFDGAMSKVFGNMMYVSGVYQLTLKNGNVLKWSFVQVWKHRNGAWQIVADVFKPAPSAKPDAK